MFGRQSPLEKFREKTGREVDDTDEDAIKRENIHVEGIPQLSPPFENTCQTNSFLKALRLSFFYDKDFIKNFKHRLPEAKKIEDALRVIGLQCREISVNASLIKMAWNTIAKVRFISSKFHFKLMYYVRLVSWF
jgi:alkyl hydroperoxide reductase subunit AhpC